jgi:hypothetical protein
MRLACWIPKATNTLKMSNTYCFSMVLMITRTRIRVTSYFVHCLSFLYIPIYILTVSCLNVSCEESGRSWTRCGKTLSHTALPSACSFKSSIRSYIYCVCRLPGFHQLFPYKCKISQVQSHKAFSFSCVIPITSFLSPTYFRGQLK